MDFLRFKGVPAAQNLGWTGPWPPPEKMVMVRGGLSGVEVFGDPADPEVSATLDEIDGTDLPFTVRWFLRTQYSKLTDEQAEHPNLARGALYQELLCTICSGALTRFVPLESDLEPYFNHNVDPEDGHAALFVVDDRT